MNSFDYKDFSSNDDIFQCSFVLFGTLEYRKVEFSTKKLFMMPTGGQKVGKKF